VACVRTAEASSLAAVGDQEVVVRPLLELREERRVVAVAHFLRRWHSHKGVSVGIGGHILTMRVFMWH